MGSGVRMTVDELRVELDRLTELGDPRRRAMCWRRRRSGYLRVETGAGWGCGDGCGSGLEPRAGESCTTGWGCGALTPYGSGSSPYLAPSVLGG